MILSTSCSNSFRISSSLRRRSRHLVRCQNREDHVAPMHVVQETITFITADGIVRIPGRLYEVPRASKLVQPMPSWEESLLCIGQTFEVAATNGKDPRRRINFLGFCQSIDILHEAVEETVMSRGGEVLEQERKLKSGVHEQLKLTVCIPYLWGVPPEVEVLSAAIQQGGGIVDKVYRQWGIYPNVASPVHTVYQ